MKILLVGINSKFIHSNLAIQNLKLYAKDYNKHIETLELTINNNKNDILRSIYKKRPEVIAFSCYIWNINIVREISIEIKKVLPYTDVWYGGPEVSYDPIEELENSEHIKGIFVGEGEATFKEVVEYYLGYNIKLESINGIAYYNDSKEIAINPSRQPLKMDEIPFAYEDMELYKNRIIYYETSRGCPFNCQYCLSSIHSGVRLRSFDVIKEELAFFIKEEVKQVKFVDRTFNCNKKHAMNIWKYISENDRGSTNFHFEIAADLLDDDMISYLNTVRPGLFQFEIGVQSTAEETLDIIKRKMDFERLCEIVTSIDKGKNIHQHLDLIAGLPEEDYNTFKKSFDDVYRLTPEQLQLGFLKVLKGSGMHINQQKYGLKYQNSAPYEILCTNVLSYDEVLKLKLVEEMVELYYNSNQFSFTIKYLETLFDDPFTMYETIANYYEENQLTIMQHSRITRYKILLDFYTEKIKSNVELFKSLLTIDLYARENLKKRPEWTNESNNDLKRDFYNNKENIEKYLKNYSTYSIKQVSRMTHIESIPFDISKFIITGNLVIKEGITHILFDYLEKDTLTNQAKIQVIN